MMEEFLRRTLLFSKGDPTVLVTRPVSAGLLLVAAVLLSAVLLPTIRRGRKEAFKEE